jgi:type I restriction enzyme S subunit
LKSYKLSELGFVGRGRSRHRPRDEPSLYGGAYPFFQTGDVKGAELYLTEYSQTYSEKGLAQSKLWEPGTLCITIAANIADTAILGVRGCFPDSVVGFVADSSKADVRYVKYYIDTLQARMQGVSRGTTQDNLSLEKLLAFELLVPPLEQQIRIAGVLGAYDDLIENNRRRGRILEEMARALYREWFVTRRVRDLARPAGSQELPHGWSRTPLRDCVEVNPRVVVPREGEKPFVSMGALSNDSMIIGDIEQRTGNSGSKFQNGDTLFARITPCLENGKTGFVQFLPDGRSVAFGSTEFIVLRSKTLTPEFIYLLSRTDEFRGTAIKSMSGASGRQRVQERCFDTMSVVHPSAEVLARFTGAVAPMFRLVHHLHLQNLNLRATRDLLLPRLLSGQLSLGEIDDNPALATESVAASV